jgi:transcriptional regulator with XRE-family HTH domain
MKQQELKKIKLKLPRGAKARIAERLGIHRQTVNDFLNGKSNNVDIYIELMKEVRDHTDKMKELNRLLDQIEL